MRTHVQRWGNSLAIRIPRALATETGIEEGSEVEFTLEAQRILLTPISARAYSLDALLTEISPDELHTERDWGRSEGAEAR